MRLVPFTPRPSAILCMGMSIERVQATLSNLSDEELGNLYVEGLLIRTGGKRWDEADVCLMGLVLAEKRRRQIS